MDNDGKWAEFFSSIIFIIVIPLIPLIYECFLFQSIKTNSAPLTAAIYAVSIAGSSNNKLYLAVSFLFTLLFSMIYGGSVLGKELYGSCTMSIVSISISAIAHTKERIKRHLYDAEPFWNL